MMNSYSMKDYVETCFLITVRSCEPQKFCAMFNLSTYEYNVAISNIGHIITTFGCELRVSKNNLSFKVTDDKKYETYKNIVFSFYYTHRFSFNNDINIYLQSSICKYFMWRQGTYVSIDELAEFLGYSKSALRSPIKSSRDFFSDFNIEIRNVPHYGMIVDDVDEFTARMCLCTLYALCDVRIIRADNENKDIINALNSDCYTKIIDSITMSLKNNNIYISNLGRRFICYYLIIQNARIRKGFVLDKFSSSDQKLIDEIRKMRRFHGIVLEMFKMLENELDFGPYGKEEVLSVECLLVSFMALPEVMEELVETLYLDEMRDVYGIVNKCIEDKYSTVIDGVYMKCLNTCIHQVIIRAHLHILPMRGLRVNGRLNKIYSSPLVLKIVEDLANDLGAYYSCKIPKSQIIEMGDIIYYYIQSKDCQYSKPRICITSRNSNFEPLLLKNLISSNLSANYYETIDILDYDTILNKTNSITQQYDLILCDQVLIEHPNLVSYDASTVNINTVANLVKMHRSFSKGILTNEMLFARNFLLDEKDESDAFYSYLSQMFNKSRADVEKIIANPVFVKNTLICIVNEPTDKTFLLIGNVKGKLTYEEQINNYIILHAEINSNNIKFYNTLLMELANDSIFFANLVDSCDTKTIDMQFNYVMY